MEVLKMRKLLILVLSLVLIAGLIGCSQNNTPVPKKYTMKITFAGEVSGESLSARGVSSPADPVEKDPGWYKEQTSTDHFFGTNFSGGYYWGTAAQAVIVDQYGEPLSMSAEDAENYIAWTSPDADGKIKLTGDLNWTGYNVSFAPLEPAILNFTAIFTYDGGTTEASARIVVFHRPQIDLARTDPEVPDGFDFTNGIGTTFENSDIFYTCEDGINYINAPGGISLILHNEENPFLGGISDTLLGGVLQVPDNLVFDVKVPAEYQAIYILKPKSGVGYVKMSSTTWTDGINHPFGTKRYQAYEYSSTGVFQLHW
jgi:hypothetical protein